MDSLIKSLLIGIAVTIIGTVIWDYWKNKFGSKDSIGIGIVIIILMAVFWLLPPYEVESTNWCLSEDGSIKVTGRLAESPLGSAVPGYPIQIKIYEAGQGDPPFKGGKFATTDVDGVFSVQFSPPALTLDKSYLINTAYAYNTPLFGERWYVCDFRKGYPSSCGR